MIIPASHRGPLSGNEDVTHRSRIVLSDCELALEFLEQATTEEIWRVHWFAAIGLVRTVGDVLHKVDGQNPTLKLKIARAYQAWKADRKQHSIFWDFIKDQRDKLIHEYESDVHPLEKVPVAVEFHVVSLEDGSKHTVRDVMELDENIYRPMLDGPWEGDDARDVLRDAIDWWKTELDKIDSQP
jgi:hypothetical protein